MRIVAFAGPSLPPAERARYPDVDWHPPAEAGDLLRLPPNQALTICLIDGFFDHRPAVRHKEILLLLSEGVRVFGASSIGALRAAEMDGFGMIGVGAIYRAFAAGRITGDDEVALAHGPAEWDWRPVSVPLVDVRATLIRAVRHRILSRMEARRLREAAAAIHYADRDWPEILRALPHHSRFESWRSANAVSQKNLDAHACLAAALAAPARSRRLPPAVRTSFLAALAAELGIDLAARTSAAAEAGPGSTRDAPPSGTGGR